ncbi:MAG: geranylgeranyl diphosphate synthase, partial [Phycisphaerales bacterium]|nr:geranylgeranyl diphosphate synthase [Phycisphaerales bacterium]
MDLLSREQRHRLESHLGPLVERVLRGCGGADAPPAVGGSRGPLVETIRQFVLDGGKRVRPQLCLWAYAHARPDGGGIGRSGSDVGGPTAVPSPAAFPSAVLDVACAWELFHAFLLCHDDIIDRSDRRRGRPTLHHRLAGLDGGSVVFGANLGIVAGDLLCVGSMRLLHELDLTGTDGGPALTAAAYQRLLKLFSRVACETGFGQAVD